MSMNYKEVPRGLPQEEAVRYSQGIALVENFVDSLRRQGLLPERFVRPQEASINPTEILAEAITFTNEERRILIEDGAVIYLPTGETIRSQEGAGRPFWHIADGFKIEGKNRLTEFPSRRIEVAIYPDPEKFFVPESFNKTTDQQIALVQEDARFLRERLGLPNIGEILPEASEATEVIFKHVDTTNVRLLGLGYMHKGYWSYIRTNTPTNKVGSHVADVGDFLADGGLDVDDWLRDWSFVRIGAARWVVPQGTR